MKSPLTLILMIPSMVGFTQDFDAYQKGIYRNKDGDTLLYRVLLPEPMEEGTKYPLVLFLHGAGERGEDNQKQLIHGGNFFLTDTNRTDFPAIILFPQCPSDRYWIDISIRSELQADSLPTFYQSVEMPSKELALVNALVEETVEKYKADKNRIYLMGLSMGSFGTFETLARWPEKYAAAIGICGGGNLELAENYARNTSIWITHGDQDNVVPVQLSRNLYQQIKSLGGDVRYTELAGTNHNAWDPTFALPQLLPWLFSQTKYNE